MLEAFRKKIGEKQWAMIQEAIKIDQSEQDPMVQEWFRDREVLKPYWGLADVLTTLLPREEQRVWEEYLQAGSPDRQRELRLENPSLSQHLKDLREEKLYLRTNNPEIDRALQRWYGNVSIEEQIESVPVPRRGPQRPERPRQHVGAR